MWWGGMGEERRRSPPSRSNELAFAARTPMKETQVGCPGAVGTEARSNELAFAARTPMKETQVGCPGAVGTEVGDDVVLKARK